MDKTEIKRIDALRKELGLNKTLRLEAKAKEVAGL